jgi:hypothetical protein
MRSFVILLLTYIIRVIKSRRMTWAGQLGRIGGEMKIQNSEKRNGRNHLEDLYVNGRIIFEWILEK